MSTKKSLSDSQKLTILLNELDALKQYSLELWGDIYDDVADEISDKVDEIYKKIGYKPLSKSEQMTKRSK